MVSQLGQRPEGLEKCHTPCRKGKRRQGTCRGSSLISHSVRESQALLQGEPSPLLAEQTRLYSHSHAAVTLALHSRVKQEEQGAVRRASFGSPSTLHLGISTATGRWPLGKDSPCPAECPLSAEGGCFLPLAAGFVCASAAFPCGPP